MTKRPRLSPNMRTPISMQPDATSDVLDAGVPPAPAMRISRADVVEPPQATATLAMPLQDDHGADTLPRIFGDAVVAFSLASTFGWTQAVMLQLRLSSYLMNPPRDTHPAR